MVLYPRRSCPVTNLPPASETGDTQQGQESPWSSVDLSLHLLLLLHRFPLWLCRGRWICQLRSSSPSITKTCGLRSLSSPQRLMITHSYRSFNPHPSGPLEFGSLIVAPLGNSKSGFCLFIVSNHVPLLPSCAKKEGDELVYFPNLPLPTLNTHSCSQSHSHSHTCSHTHTRRFSLRLYQYFLGG